MITPATSSTYGGIKLLGALAGSTPDNPQLPNGYVTSTMLAQTYALASALTTETNRALAAEAALSAGYLAAVSAEISARTSALSSESSTRASADAALNAAIAGLAASTTTTGLQGQITNIQNALTAETARAQAAESVNATGLTTLQTSLATETARAQAAEAAALQKSNNFSDVTNVATARNNLGLGSAALQPTSAFDVAGAAATVQSNLTTEIARAQAAEALKLAAVNNLSDLTNLATARLNLGLGSAALQAASAFDTAGAAAAEQTRALAAEALKANDNAVVHLTGTETVTGQKNFTGGLQSGGSNVVITTDSRLSDARNPLTHSVSDASVVVGGLTDASISATAAINHTKFDSAAQNAITLANSAVQTINGKSAVSGAVTLVPSDVSAIPTGTVTTKGDLIVGQAANNPQRLGVGSDASILIADSTQPLGVRWGTPGTSGVPGQLTPTATQTSAYSANASDLVISNATTTSFNVTLPTAPGDQARVGALLLSTASAHTVTLVAGGTDTIADGDSSTTYLLKVPGQVVILQYKASSTQWIPTAQGAPLYSLDARYDAAGVAAAEQTRALAAEALLAPLASPTFTGTPQAPTPTVNDDTNNIATTAYVINQGSSSTPLMDSTVGAAGSSLSWARADHVHPVDTSRAPLSSPILTGTPQAPTAAADTNTTQIASTAFVLGQADASAPLMDGTASAGSATRFSRADHVHPSDTTRAPLASPVFTGTPSAPTPSPSDNSTTLATTAFVQLALGSGGIGSLPRIATVKDPVYGARGGAKTFTSGATVSGSTLTDTTHHPFTSADTGKTIIIQGVAAATTGGQSFTTTITYVSSTQVTLAAAPPNPGSATGSYQYGWDDTTPFQNAVNANAPGFLIIPPDQYLVNSIDVHTLSGLILWGYGATIWKIPSPVASQELPLFNGQTNISPIRTVFQCYGLNMQGIGLITTGPVAGYQGDSIMLRNFTDVVIRDCIVNNFQDGGITCFGCARVWYQNIEVTNCTSAGTRNGLGIYDGLQGSVPCSDIVVTDCYINNVRQGGVALVSNYVNVPAFRCIIANNDITTTGGWASVSMEIGDTIGAGSPTNSGALRQIIISDNVIVNTSNGNLAAGIVITDDASPTTTVNGAGQTISTTASTLNVGSVGGFASSGIIFVSGVVGPVTYTGVTASPAAFTGCTVTSGSFTPLNGANVSQAVLNDPTRLQDLVITGNYINTTGSNASTSGASLNFSSLSRTLVANNTVVHNGGGQLVNWSNIANSNSSPNQYNVIANNLFVATGINAAQNQSLLHLSYMAHTRIFGNSIIGPTSGSTGGSGLFLDSTGIGCTFMSVRDNRIEYAPAAGINASMIADTIIEGNEIYNCNVANNANVAGISLPSASGNRLGSINTIKYNTIWDDRVTPQMTWAVRGQTNGGTNPYLIGNQFYRAASSPIDSPNNFAMVADNISDVPNSFPAAPGALTLGASPATIAATSYGRLINISGGTVSSVTKTRQGGSALAVNTSGELTLLAGDTATITYSVAPTVNSWPIP